jgi:Putative adhesin
MQMPTTVRQWPELPPESKGPYARLKERLGRPWARRALRLTGLLLLVALVLIGGLAVLLFVTRTYRLDSVTYPGTVRRLTVEADRGEVDTVGSDRRDLLALWQKRYSLIKPRVDGTVQDGTLGLRSHCPVLSLRCYVVLGSQVPAATAVSVQTRSASVSMQDLRAPVDVTTGSGAVSLEGIAAAVRVATDSGAVSLGGLRGELAASTVSAPIELRDVGGRARVSSDSGTITGNAQVLQTLVARTGSGWVTAAFDAPPERVEIRSASGEISLEVPAGRYRLDLHAPAGRVHVQGVVNDPAATRTISITTGAGIEVSAA